MIWIEVLHGKFIIKGGLCFIKRNTMLLFVLGLFIFIPIKFNIFHMYIVFMYYFRVKYLICCLTIEFTGARSRASAQTAG